MKTILGIIGFPVIIAFLFISWGIMWFVPEEVRR